jgi:hypothetical protein
MSAILWPHPIERYKIAHRLLDPPHILPIPLWRLCLLLLPCGVQLPSAREEEQDRLDRQRDVGEEVRIEGEEILEGEGMFGESK